MQHSPSAGAPQQEHHRAAQATPPRTPWSQWPARALEMWLHLTAPPEASATASFAQRDHARRGRLASVITLTIYAVVLATVPVGVALGAIHLSIYALLLAASIAVVLNRHGWVSLTGVTLVLGIDLALLLIIIGHPDGQLASLELPFFDLFVISELVAASLLPGMGVYLVGAFNIAVIALDLRLQPVHAHLETALLTSNGFIMVLLPPVALQVLVAVVAALWATSTARALHRATAAEEIAELRRREAELITAQAQRTRELEAGVRELLRAHTEVANGNFQARVPLMNNALLWKVGISFNTLIGRLSRLAEAEAALRRHWLESHRTGQPMLPAPMQLLPERARVTGQFPPSFVSGELALPPPPAPATAPATAPAANPVQPSPYRRPGVGRLQPTPSTGTTGGLPPWPETGPLRTPERGGASGALRMPERGGASGALPPQAPPPWPAGASARAGTGNAPLRDPSTRPSSADPWAPAAPTPRHEAERAEPVPEVEDDYAQVPQWLLDARRHTNPRLVLPPGFEDGAHHPSSGPPAGY